MKTILVATDFSPSAKNAANYAADMALTIKAGILLLHVYQIPVSYSEIPVALDVEDMMEEIKEGMNEQKEHLIRKTGGKLNIETDVRRGIFFYDEFKIACEQVKPYAVIMGSQGTTASERLFFGGHTVHAMKHLRWPLITVPFGATFSSIKKIGFACDFDKVIDTTPIDEIKILVNDFNAELHILNIVKNERLTPEAVYESALLQEMLSALKPGYHLITNGNTDEGIMNFVEINHIDLLIVLPKRHALLSKLIHRSHTKQFVLHSHVPVMALHQ